MAVETSAKTVIQCGLKYKNNKRGNIHLQIVLKMQIDTSGNRKEFEDGLIVGTCEFFYLYLLNAK